MTTDEHLQAAIDQLTESERGHGAAVALLAFLEGGGAALDEEGQGAVQTILTGAWGGLAGTTLDALRDKTGN